jgi:hypothetical protein
MTLVMTRRILTLAGTNGGGMSGSGGGGGW